MTDYASEWPLLRAALEELRLPIEPGYIEQILRTVVENVYRPSGLSDSEAHDELTESWRLWMDGGAATSALKKSVALALSEVPELGNLGQKYFSCVKKLEESYYLSRPEAIEVLENATLISRLRGTCNLSYGRISTVVGLDQYPWNAIEAVAMGIGFKSSNESFTKKDIEEIYATDAEFANRFYGDDTEEEAIGTLDTALARLDVDTVISDDLKKIFEISFDPHRVILHFELSTIEKFDKMPGEVIYEFSPRGEALNRLWEEYEANTSEPYLNNAKSVYSLDWSWAKSKYNRPNKDLGDGPFRMMEIFEVLRRLAYPTRKYVARLIRALMVRHQITTVTEPIKMPDPTPETIEKYLASVAAANTGTGGTFEQRAVDYAVTMEYPEEMYRISGIGSSVNETNLSTLKFGDIECIDVEAREIIAFEPHGGSLSDVYVDGHVNSLNRIAPLRLQKLNASYGQGDWSLTIVFLSHNNSRLNKHMNGEQLSYGSIGVTFRYMHFSEFLAKAQDQPKSEAELAIFKATVTDRVSNLPNSSYLREAYARATQ